MLGFGRRKNSEQDTQIPYQVYETVNEPAARRQRWILRLVLALIVATVLILGLVYLRRYMQSRNGPAGTPTGQAEQVQQPPQDNAELPVPEGDPAKLPISDGTNDKIVDQPQ